MNNFGTAWRSNKIRQIFFLVPVFSARIFRIIFKMATSKTYAMKNFSMLISFFLSSLGSLVAVFTRNVEYLLSLRRQQQRHLFNAVEDHNAVLRKMQNLKHR